ncbi:hypothetical protein T07_5477 [Trichinella nelsoni]|uniref:Uncharacterized protein n=1 Tax=Trichinella nelsoni TaxID=6336 RepID=A0A0V0SBP5_9BILA|nr:hypothetical protein T07_5477 [Trichinella nelsoni]
MDNEQHSAPECEAKYDKEDMILEQRKLIMQQIKDLNVNVQNVQDTTKRLHSIIESRGTLKTKDALISKDENLKSQEFYDSTASKMQVSTRNDSKLQLWANFRTGASSFQRQKQAEKNTEVCSEQQAKSCLSSTISKEYENQELVEHASVIPDEQRFHVAMQKYHGLNNRRIEGTFAAIFENAGCRMQFMEMVNQAKLKFSDN